MLVRAMCICCGAPSALPFAGNAFDLLSVLWWLTDFQRLVCASRQLVAGQVGDLLEEADTIEMLLDINGGMRAKWRKKRMRRLRRKRRKMRQRAR